MGSVLRTLMAAEGWSRISHRLKDGQVDPVLLMPDGSIRAGGKCVDIAEARIDAAWFGIDLTHTGQVGRFLSDAISSPSLRWMQSCRAGTDDPAFAALAAKGVRITTSSGPAPAIAEYVLANVLDLFQRGAERRAAQAAGRWEAFPFREVSASRWTCVGFGQIGGETARRARAMGAHVTGVRRSGGSDPNADAIVLPDAMDEALSQSDVVVLSVPLTAATQAAFGEQFFRALKPGALFINVGRGPLVDEQALRRALDSGHLSHAVLDVVAVEPLPSDAWQWRHPRITLTAHGSGLGSGLFERTDALFIENVRRYLADEPLMLEAISDQVA